MAEYRVFSIPVEGIWPDEEQQAGHANSDTDDLPDRRPLFEEEKGGRRDPERRGVAQHDCAAGRDINQTSRHERREGDHVEQGDYENDRVVGPRGTHEFAVGMEAGNEYRRRQCRAYRYGPERCDVLHRQLHDDPVETPGQHNEDEKPDGRQSRGGRSTGGQGGGRYGCH